MSAIKAFALRLAQRARPAMPEMLTAPSVPSPEDEVRSVIEASGLLDVDYYLDVNPDVAELGLDPIDHYVRFGSAEGRRPHVGFDPKAYLAAHPDVAAAGVEPLTHYIRSGRHEGRGLEPPDRVRSSTTQSLMRQALLGRAFFREHGLSARRGVPLGDGIADAVDDLIGRTPALRLDRLEPEVSIVIPVYGELPFVLNCLEGLSEHRSRHSVEIILLDDASPADTLTSDLGAIPWIRYHRRAENGGFIAACNTAAALARGRYLVFLNSDTRVAESWLDELIGSFAIYPRAGLIGSKLLNEDMTLQEAGGIFWNDGSAWNYGRGDDPDNPKYSYARQVDFCSGAAIAVPAAAWQAMDGFDSTFAPAYCEDADLAFRLRAAGYEVWLQPLAGVLHYEGRTHGRDTSSGVKAYQVVNLKKFKERWRAVLSGHGTNGVAPVLEATRYAKPRMLVADATTLTPDRDAGSFVARGMLRVIQGLGYDLAFIPQHNFLHAGSYTEALQREGVECFYAPFTRSFSDVLSFHAGFETVLGYRFNVLAPIYDEIRKAMPSACVLFNNVDLHYLRQEREAALYGSRSGRVGAMVTKAAELELISKVDCTIVHTKVESDIIRGETGVENVIEIPWIAEVERSDAPFDARHDIMFLGGFGHQPNVDGVRYFVDQIWPLLLPRLPPTARLVIAGAQAPALVRAFASDRIIVTGYVEDLQAQFDAARVFIAPLRYGAGIKGKVIESMRRGAPSVVTTIAAEGIGLQHGTHALIADGPAEFCEAVLALYDDRTQWQRMQEAGYAFVVDNFSPQRCAQLFENALDMAADTWIRRQEHALRSSLRNIAEADGRSGEA